MNDNHRPMTAVLHDLAAEVSIKVFDIATEELLRRQAVRSRALKAERYNSRRSWRRWIRWATGRTQQQETAL